MNKTITIELIPLSAGVFGRDWITNADSTAVVQTVIAKNLRELKVLQKHYLAQRKLEWKHQNIE